MKKIAIIIFNIMVTALLPLVGCSSNVNVTYSDATTMTTYNSEKYIWEQLEEDHEGTINVQGTDYYYRLAGEDDEEAVFHGVTFVPDYASYLISQGECIIAPYTYYALAEFEDGTSETLINVGFLFEQEIFISISEHDNPHAGIIQIHDKDTNETTMYLLVSLTE